ncbi:hypothetical protein [Neptuniibacter sp.]|uniref:hypothetical protein n=1 Tax=Neptuniibacter sp. TaxID=1962643 RepID=UPI00262B269C|nr:hypothetical protein [Neptuniibacter sp.]MCP4595270.1 hypothetical protein [Neptuniibacter sp.]
MVCIVAPAAPSLLIAAIIGFRILSESRNRFATMAGLFTLKPIIATPLWAIIAEFNFGRPIHVGVFELEHLFPMIPGVGLTILIVIAFWPLFLRYKSAFVLLGLDIVRWGNSYLLQRSADQLFLVTIIVGLAMPAVFAVVAHMLVRESAELNSVEIQAQKATVTALSTSYSAFRRPNNLLSIILIPILITGLGLYSGNYLGGTIYEFLNSGAFAKWQSLGAPSERSVKIAAASTWSITVETTDDQVFTSQSDSWEWRLTDEYLSMERSPPCYYPQTPAPPGEVIDSVEISLCDRGNETVKYVLLQDGSVWRWEHSAYWGYTLGASILGTLSGAGMGLLVGISISLRLGRKAG